jgi:protein-tyrosine phosphatase
MVRVGFVCTGNICRSPMAEVVLSTLVAGVSGPALVAVASAGTANWHVGNPMDPRARDALDRAGFTAPGPLATYADPAWLSGCDLIITMTHEQRHDVQLRLDGASTPVTLLRSYLGDELDLADPYYGDDVEFDQCLATIIRSCRELVRVHRLGRASSAT